MGSGGFSIYGTHYTIGVSQNEIPIDPRISNDNYRDKQKSKETRKIYILIT